MNKYTKNESCDFSIADMLKRGFDRSQIAAAMQDGEACAAEGIDLEESELIYEWATASDKKLVIFGRIL